MVFELKGHVSLLQKALKRQFILKSYFYLKISFFKEKNDMGRVSRKSTKKRHVLFD